MSATSLSDLSLHDISPNSSGTTTDQNRSTEVNTMHEDLARAQMSARLGEAQELRAGHQVARARRLSRKAERAAQQARLALARAL
ncbi:hypothetical protein BH09ACT12_BH09ACT12_23910 [soil metagenome]